MRYGTWEPAKQKHALFVPCVFFVDNVFSGFIIGNRLSGPPLFTKPACLGFQVTKEFGGGNLPNLGMRMFMVDFDPKLF